MTIVALDCDELVLVRQTRPGAGGWTVELPSGCIEPGETPAEAAARELAEECGLAAAGLTRLGAFWAVPAYSTEWVHVYAATGLSAAGPQRLDADEDVVALRCPVADAERGVIDAISLAALALYRRAVTG